MSATVHRDFSEGMDPSAIRSHATDFRRAQDAAKTAQSNARLARKRLKDSGIDLHAWDLASTLSKLDPAEAIIRLNRAYFYLKSLHAPVGAQLGFHEALDNQELTDEQRTAKWRADGANAFLSGKRETDCPYSQELPACHAWLNGFRDQEWETQETKTKAELNETNKVDQIVPDAKAKKRGRPKAEPAPAPEPEKVATQAPVTVDPEEIPFVEAAPVPAVEGDMPPAPPLDDSFPA